MVQSKLRAERAAFSALLGIIICMSERNPLMSHAEPDLDPVGGSVHNQLNLHENSSMTRYCNYMHVSRSVNRA